VVNKVLPILMKIENTIERTEWISILTERANIEDKALLSELKNAIKLDKTVIHESHQRTDKSNKENAELYLVYLMFSDKELALKIKEQVKVEDFKDPSLCQIVELCYQLLSEGSELRIDFVMDKINEPKIKTLLSKIGVTTISFDNPKQTLIDCINALNKKTYSQQVEELKKERNKALVAGESERSQEIQDKLKQLRITLTSS